MRRTWRSMAAALLTVAGTSAILGVTAEAQTRSYTPNTYADFPYNQGSLFYRPLGATARTRPKPRPAPAPRRLAAPRYIAPQGGYYYQAPQYYYYPQGYYRPQ